VGVGSVTRILIVDDHEVVLEGLKGALGDYEGIEVVGEASDGHEALKKVDSLRPHIVIMDISMPRFNGLEATVQIKKMHPDVKVIVFTLHSHREFLHPLIKAGISGFVLKENPISDLYLAIQAVTKGGAYYSKDVQEYLVNYFVAGEEGQSEKNPFDMLSSREREVFQLLAQGASIKEAADVLCISPKTVETHKYHIMDKLRIRSMAEWTKEAIRQGIIDV
jgi:two-component system, NarL family, response regulator NreC